MTGYEFVVYVTRNRIRARKAVQVLHEADQPIEGHIHHTRTTYQVRVPGGKEVRAEQILRDAGIKRKRGG